MLSKVSPHILLFGGSGFLGRVLHRELLQAGAKISLVPREFDFVNQEMTSNHMEVKPSVLISTAWISNRSKGYLYDIENFRWVEKHIEISLFCFRNNLKLVIPGTCLEYVGQLDVPYIASKSQLLSYLQSNLPSEAFLWIRFFYLFSQDERRPRLIADALNSIEKRIPLQVRCTETKHDFIEVRDAAMQTVKMLFEQYHGIWDVGSGQLRSNNELLSKIENLEIKSAAEELTFEKQQVLWSGAATKLMTDYSHFLTYTNQFFSSI